MIDAVVEKHQTQLITDILNKVRSMPLDIGGLISYSPDDNAKARGEFEKALMPIIKEYTLCANPQEGEVTDDQLITIWRNVAQGVNNHGSFLKHFANCYITADGFNKPLLRNLALRLVTKYELSAPEYLRED